jgi:hypothetical protein
MIRDCDQQVVELKKMPLDSVNQILKPALAILSHTLEAMAASLGVLRPTFTTFYGLLNDEQKARLVAMGSLPKIREDY